MKLFNWHFIGIGGIYDISDEKFENGCEVFAQFLCPEKANSLLTTFED